MRREITILRWKFGFMEEEMLGGGTRRETSPSAFSQCRAVFVRAASTILRCRGVDASYTDRVRGAFRQLKQPTNGIIRLERGSCHRRLCMGSHLMPIFDF
jgi:hypothetical protein